MHWSRLCNLILLPSGGERRRGGGTARRGRGHGLVAGAAGPPRLRCAPHAPPIPPPGRGSAALGVTGWQPASRLADSWAGRRWAQPALFKGEGGGRTPGLQNPCRPGSLPRPESQNPRSRGRSTRCRRRHGCHDGSEVSLRATAAGSRSSSPGFPAAAAGRSATQRTADCLGLCAPIPSVPVRFLPD